MSKDDRLSKTLSEIEERQTGYLARRVEASDKERVEVTSVATEGSSAPAEIPEPKVYSLTLGATAKLSDAMPDTPDSRVCTWIECSQDKRSWAEVQEEGKGELLSVPTSRVVK